MKANDVKTTEEYNKINNTFKVSRCNRGIINLINPNLNSLISSELYNTPDLTFNLYKLNVKNNLSLVLFLDNNFIVKNYVINNHNELDSFNSHFDMLTKQSSHKHKIIITCNNIYTPYIPKSFDVKNYNDTSFIQFKYNLFEFIETDNDVNRIVTNIISNNNILKSTRIYRNINNALSQHQFTYNVSGKLVNKLFTNSIQQQIQLTNKSNIVFKLI